MSQKNLWPKKLQELNDVDPIWPAEIQPGFALVVNDNKDGFTFSPSAAKGEKGDTGDTGEAGPPNILSVGSVEIGEPNEAEVTIEGTSPEQVLNFVIPKGDRGEPGTDGTNGADATDPNFTIGGVSVGEPGVLLTGTYPNLILNYQLPPGTKGDTGDTGPANSLEIGTVTVGEEYSATITGSAPNQTLNLVMAPGPQGIPGVVQTITSDSPSLTVDDTDPVNPVLDITFPTPELIVDQVIVVTATRNLAPTDEGQYLRSTSATAVSLTVPLDLALVDSAAEIHVRQAGAGLVTIVADSGVTINAPFGGTLVLAGEGATVTLKKVATNEYDLFGLVEPAP